MTVMAEVLKAKTKKELRILAMAWTDRVMQGQWFIELGYTPDRVTRSEEGYEIYMEARR